MKNIHVTEQPPTSYETALDHDDDVIDLRHAPATAPAVPALPTDIPLGGGRPSFLAVIERFKASQLVLAADVVAVLVPALLLGRAWDFAAAALTVALVASGDLYRPRLMMSALDELPAVLGRLLSATGLLATVSVVSHLNGGPRVVLYYAAWTAAPLAFGRALSNLLVRSARRHGVVNHATLIVGSGEIARSLVRLLRDYPEYGLRPVGYVADEDFAQGAADPIVPRIGAVPQLAELVSATGASIVVVTMGGFVDARLLGVIREASTLHCQIFVVPRFLSAELRVTDHVGAIPLTRISMPKQARLRRGLKRGLDVVLSAGALAFLTPLFVACAFAVRLDSGSPVLFRQKRLGGDGKPFTLFKFRTMVPTSDDEGQTKWSIVGDPRVSGVGRFMRRFALDELPQLWNILHGDMTFVGPRPERPHFAEQFTDIFPDYRHRLRVRPGLTGLAQVSGLRGDTSIEDRARHDNYYIEQWSLWLDFKVIIRTLAEVVRGQER